MKKDKDVTDKDILEFIDKVAHEDPLYSQALYASFQTFLKIKQRIRELEAKCTHGS